MTKSRQKSPVAKASKTEKSIKSNKTAAEVKKQAVGSGISITEQREQMISDAAYYFSESRGFTPGFEMADWLQAEKQVDASIAPQVHHKETKLGQGTSL